MMSACGSFSCLCSCCIPCGLGVSCPWLMLMSDTASCWSRSWCLATWDRVKVGLGRGVFSALVRPFVFSLSE
jgi:hypothetical protein